MRPHSLNQKRSRYIGLVELYHPRVHGSNSIITNRILLNHYIVFCSKNFLLNEESAGE